MSWEAKHQFDLQQYTEAIASAPFDTLLTYLRVILIRALLSTKSAGRVRCFRLAEKFLLAAFVIRGGSRILEVRERWEGQSLGCMCGGGTLFTTLLNVNCELKEIFIKIKIALI